MQNVQSSKSFFNHCYLWPTITSLRLVQIDFRNASSLRLLSRETEHRSSTFNCSAHSAYETCVQHWNSNAIDFLSKGRSRGHHCLSNPSETGQALSKGVLLYVREKASACLLKMLQSAFPARPLQQKAAGSHEYGPLVSNKAIYNRGENNSEMYTRRRVLHSCAVLCM